MSHNQVWKFSLARPGFDPRGPGSRQRPAKSKTRVRNSNGGRPAGKSESTGPRQSATTTRAAGIPENFIIGADSNEARRAGQ